MYETIEDLLEECESRGVPLWQVILENQCRLAECGQDAVWSQLKLRYQVMKSSAVRALEDPKSTAGTLISGYAGRQAAYGRGDTICGPLINRVMSLALSGSEVNAAMGRICAAPTAGSCGILPAVLMGVAEAEALSEQTVLEGLLTASGLGTVIVKNATVSGAEGGCQAECGAAAAIAAAAAVQMKGGTPRQSAHALALALMNCMGLICDPVAGLVQIPCAQRNASQAVNALLSADLALAGMTSPVRPDQVIEAMYRVGRMLPGELKETAFGGIAAEPDAKDIAKNLFH